jgi:hypothetical protein
MKSIKWKGIDVYIHHILYRTQGEMEDPIVQYALAGKSAERNGLFKVEVEDLELNGKKLETYLLGQVERNG